MTIHTIHANDSNLRDQMCEARKVCLADTASLDDQMFLVWHPTTRDNALRVLVSDDVSWDDVKTLFGFHTVLDPRAPIGEIAVYGTSHLCAVVYYPDVAA